MSADGGDVSAEAFGEDADAVLEALSEVNGNETPPVELMAKVQQWQERLDDE